jgi:hypothetical protein
MFGMNYLQLGMYDHGCLLHSLKSAVIFLFNGILSYSSITMK